MAATLTGAPPEIVAHRGSSVAAPEHTEQAYRLAIEEGADAVECDVRLTGDRQLVCLHDRRLERTSDGRRGVDRYDLDHLRTLDFGSWHGAPASLLTFAELLEMLRDAPRRVDLAVETKHPDGYGVALEYALASAIRRAGLDRPGPHDTHVRMMSFSTGAVRRFGRLLPTVRRVLLIEAGLNPAIRGGILPEGVDTLGVSTRLLHRDPGIVARHHDRGHAVHCYTVNRQVDLDRCLSTGVDALITDRPAWARQQVRELLGVPS